MSKCAICRAPFERKYLTQKTCLEPICKQEQKRQDARRKEERAERKLRMEKIKSRTDWSKEAQQAVNAYIRERDKDLPCISCGRFHEGQWHAGHYRTTRAAPELRFSEINIHKQCAPCNNHLSGNIVEYRRNLIEKIGIESVEWLEGKHPPAKHSADDLKIIRNEYRAKLKALKSEGPAVDVPALQSTTLEG